MNYNILNRSPSPMANKPFQRTNITQQNYDPKTLQVLRESLAKELFAINEITEEIAVVSDAKIKALCENLKTQKITNVGQIFAAITYLCPKEGELLLSGQEIFLQNGNQPQPTP